MVAYAMPALVPVALAVTLAAADVLSRKLAGSRKLYAIPPGLRLGIQSATPLPHRQGSDVGDLCVCGMQWDGPTVAPVG